MELSQGLRPAALGVPSPDLRAVVVVPARDEEARIGACLDALAAQVEVEPAAYEVIVVLDACLDATERAVEEARLRWPDLGLSTMTGPGRGAGPARAVGMDVACARLEAIGAADLLLATTDADSVVAPDWIARQLEAVAAGAEAIGGEILLDSDESERLPEGVVSRREADLVERTRLAQGRGPAEHAHFSGASLGVTPRAYRRAGGMGWLVALEDQELEDRLAAAGVKIHRLRPVRVVTSARTDGRAERGLGLDLALGAWIAERSYSGGDYAVEQLLAAKRSSVAVILPAREVAATIGPTLDCLAPLREAGLIDELLVVDADSADGTAAIARGRGVEAVSESALAPELGPCLGKGDAMWRAARAVESELLVFLDADSTDFGAGFLTGMLGPILLEPGVKLVKGSFRRPFALDGAFHDGEGGRVTELVARPLLNLHFPGLAGFVQPLAGEIAIERDLFRRLSVPVGYGVEIAMLIDALALVGLDALAQVDLDARQNRHQSLRALSAMAFEVMVAVERRTGAGPRPDAVSFRPRSEVGGEPVTWRLRCEERPPTLSL
ncbi:MAG TPA: glucosyl-3-phosphoglycerate synthase [Solirubrobacterales bacterium]|jgi:glucosyl-3-phosphoglycerate synthase|nr:glucosyl-3-phosphoglycerate synthase [Solirubrobacterales bacterium]